MSCTLLWFRQDLRVTDNPALLAAAERGGPVVPVYIWSPQDEGEWAPGGASRWWLHHALAALQRQLKSLGSRLILRQGPAPECITQLARETGASAVLWTRRYEPHTRAVEQEVESALVGTGVGVETFNGSLLLEPEGALTKQGRPYQVFTAFWNASRQRMAANQPVAAPSRLPAPAKWPRNDALADFQLLPKLGWSAGFTEYWKPEADPGGLLEEFVSDGLADYPQDRDHPALHGTSRLSPYLHHGQISPRQVWQRVAGGQSPSSRRSFHSRRRDGDSPNTRRGRSASSDAFLRQIAWREFGNHLLYHFPETPEQPLRPEFRKLGWRDDPAALSAWQKGCTGYPLVDAGMRELWRTGWMHNRVRLVVASFLTKDLLIPWQLGEKWFWDTLVDADLANNTLGWQWVAGCGADAAPYFRILNPVLQGERFDPGGDYVRKWVPELAKLPDEWIHQPWAAPPLLLADAGVQLGRDYPEPLIEHAAARKRALAAYERMRGRS